MNKEQAVAEAIEAAYAAGVEAGKASAYIGTYDQYDRGSLMFKKVAPYTDAVKD
jgi:hypothetical protein